MSFFIYSFMGANIYNITNYSDTLTNCVMIDGLTTDIIKRKYIWLLNAIIDNAIIGEDDYGLVWYSGTWYSGEWEDGTWYSGIWVDGEWKNGNFYSYRFDTKQLLQRYKRILEKDNPIYSQFRHGIWRRGNFYNGYFGPGIGQGVDKDYDGWDQLLSSEIMYYDTRWESGIFYNGIFRNAVWLSYYDTDSIFKNGVFYNSEWVNGTFLSGTFQGYEWWNGKFNGGDFVGNPNLVQNFSSGSSACHWWNGVFNQTDPNIRSRFGTWITTGTTDVPFTNVVWHDGVFYKGEFHSGLNIISGKTSISNNHNRSVWSGGTWFDGTWYGGTHLGGEFNNGYWQEGIWQGGDFNNGSWLNGFWSGGTINNGFFSSGLFNDVVFNGGQSGYQPSDIILYKQNLNLYYLTTPPKFYNG